MHPHLKEARDGHADKIRRINGAHGTKGNPSGNQSPGGTSGNGKFMAEKPGENIPNGPQGSVGLASIKAEGKKPSRNLGKFARGGRTKGKKGTTVNIVVSPSHPPMPTAAPAMPMPHPAVAPPAGGMPGAGGPPPGLPPGALRPGMMPPGIPPGMPPRALGGRAFKRGGKVAENTAPQYPQKVKTAHKQDLKAKFKRGGAAYDAGSLTGDGRLEKVKNYGKKAHNMKAPKV